MHYRTDGEVFETNPSIWVGFYLTVLPLHKFCISMLGYFSVLLVNCALFSGLAWADTINILAITRFDLGSLDVCTGLLIFDVVSIRT